MPYTMQSLPEYIKKKSKAVQEQWLKVFNAAFAEKGETYAFKTANAAIKETFGINDTFSRTLLSELLADIDLIITRAGDGLKGREGSPIVRTFLKEVKTKVKNMISKITDKETKALAESIVTKLEEIDKTGSFGDIESRVRAAIKLSTWFPEKVGEQYAEGPYIRDSSFAYIEPGGTKDKDGKTVPRSLRHLPYKDKNGKVDLPHLRNALARLEQTDIPEAAKKTAAAKLNAAAKVAKIGEFKESGVKIESLREAQEQDFMVSEFVSLKEAKFNSDFSEVEVVLIEAGVNEGKKRYYPDTTVLEAAGLFAGWKMYLNHPTVTEEKELPERDITKWASTIMESYSGKNAATERPTVLGRVAIHDSWLRERLADPVARQHIGLSINTGGKISVGRVNGKDGYQIVEAIIPRRKNGPPSVDWVTEPGARGRVSRLLESKNGGTKMELENATLKDLKESRQDLVEAINKETTAGNAEKVAKFEKDLKEANEKIAAFEKAQSLAKQCEVAEAILKEAKIPEPCKERIRAQVKSAVIEAKDEVVLKEAISKIVAAELEFVNKLTGKGKIKLGEGTTTDLKESLGKELDKRAGVEEKKEGQEGK